MSNYPIIHPQNPVMGNGLTRLLGRTMLTVLGWKIEGVLPQQSKLVAVAAPHTSNWDFFIAMASMLAMGIQLSWLAKSSIFRFPFRRILLRLGGVPVDRSAPEEIVGQVATYFEQHDKCFVCITPEGTRGKVQRWKTGFMRIAKTAGVPVLLVAWHYPEKRLILGPLIELTDDVDKDMSEIQTYFGQFVGKWPQ